MNVSGDGSIKTWSVAPRDTTRVHVSLVTNDNPIDAKIETWQGPEDIPQDIDVYVEGGARSRFVVVLSMPGLSNTLAVRNFVRSVLDSPRVQIVADITPSLKVSISRISNSKILRDIHPDHDRTYPLAPFVEKTLVAIMTDGYPLKAHTELLQGPLVAKQVIHESTQDSFARPVYAIISTPGTRNAVRISNECAETSTISAFVEPIETN